MNLFELKECVDRAIIRAAECGESSESVLVSIQIDDSGGNSAWSSELEACYDNNTNASGFVLLGVLSD